MSEYTAVIRWARSEGECFIDNQYSRGHTWEFDGGVIVPASSSPHVVPLPYSVETNVDPEEAFIAALSSCHMLVFLSIAAKRKYIIESYLDNAVGLMEKDGDGKTSVTKVRLRPHIIFSGERQPTMEQLEKMHHLSHENCFIANSVKTAVTTEIIV
ncbi:OsmC family peroxiredoxin [Shewanella canadensis]|uniref:OsmC family peroxiredoxin n=1 Tax=Shewanella canadensis TaxID=271096 RepID=A0A3S0KST5_9GAMM|nr:OsmC family protein [Shewanella canadensis]RTR37614.1 OsmC family peroxiredoxin [Shewanella canadensis]